jgi:SAM-dependent methyltransferase
VLEHLHDPLAALKRARRLLRPGGLVAVLFVPRFDSREAQRFGPRWLALDLPRHLTHFSDATFRALAAAAGLRVVHQEDYSRRHNAAQLVGSLFPSLQKHRFYQREAGDPTGEGHTAGDLDLEGDVAAQPSALTRRLAPAARRGAFLAATAAAGPVCRRRARRGDTGVTSYFLVPSAPEEGDAS